MDITRKFFTVWVVSNNYRLLREAVDILSLKVFKVSCGNLI